MRQIVVVLLRCVLGVLGAGSLFVLAVMVPLLVADLAELRPEYDHLRIALPAVFTAGVVTGQVVLVCVWRLVTMVREGTVFSVRAFRFVDVMIGAIIVGGLVVFGLAAALAPGEAVAPGVVALICGLSLAVFAVALIVFVLRTLLAQAVARDAEATRMQAELDEVI
ncbi:DUF2975 domain-containing protein [Actinocorallia aurea]